MEASVLELESILQLWTHRHRGQRALTHAGRGLALGLLLSLLAAAGLVFARRLLPQEFAWLTAAGALAGLAVGGSLGWILPFPKLQAARWFDLRFGLRERVSTALEQAQLAGRPDGPPADLPDDLRFLLYRDALEAARRVQLSSAYPLRLPRIALLLALALLAGHVLFGLRAGPLFAAALQQRAVEQAIDRETERVEELIEAIERNAGLTPEQRQALTTPLQDAARRLQDAQTMEEAVWALSEGEAELQALQDLDSAELAQRLQEAGRQLGASPDPALQTVGDALASADLEGAANALENLDPSQLTAEQADALAAELEAAAQTLGEAAPEVAQQLNAAAQALRAGDAQVAQAALQEAAAALTDAGSDLTRNRLAAQAASQLRQARQAVGSRAPGAQTAQNGSASNAGNDPGNQGSGSSPNGNNNGAAGSAGRGESDGGEGSGPPAGSNPIQGGNGPGDGGLRPYEQIYAPQRLGGQDGPEIALPGGEGQPGDEVMGEGGTPPGQTGPSQVPYQEVFAQYAEAYRQAMESGQVPVHLRQLIREYFSNLEP